MSIFGNYQTRFEDTQQEEYSLEEYLSLCKSDSSALCLGRRTPALGHR